MARHIKTLIELSSSQTREFLASLGDGENEANRKKAIDKARSTNFIVVSSAV